VLVLTCWVLRGTRHVSAPAPGPPARPPAPQTVATHHIIWRRRTDMRSMLAVSICAALLQAQSPSPAQPAAPDDPVKTLVGRLDLDKYKATIKGLTQFGDRRQGTQRNRDAVNWIQKQLESYGYTNAERIKYDPPVPARECGPSVPASVVQAREGGAGRAGGAGGPGRGANPDSGQGGARLV